MALSCPIRIYLLFREVGAWDSEDTMTAPGCFWLRQLSSAPEEGKQGAARGILQQQEHVALILVVVV